MLSISLFGNFKVLYEGQEVAALSRDRFKLLLAYLVLHERRPQARRYIAMRFWPDSSEQQAQTNLRKLLTDLRRAFPPIDQFLVTRDGYITWQTDTPYQSDVAQFEQALSRAEHTSDTANAVAALLRAVSLYHGDLLPQFYDDWILVERDRLRNAMTGALERLVLLYEQQQNYATAIRHLYHLARLDPLREETYRWLMRLHALHDDRDGIIRTYRVCRDLLARELDIEPSQPTRQLYEQLLAQKPDTPALSPADAVKALTPLVGRKQEWNQLLAAWQRALQGEPHCVLITGEAGIGKSRLIEELLQQVKRRGFRSVYARAHELNHAIPFAPVASWLRTDWLFSKIHSLNPLWRRELARLVPELLVEQPDLATPAPLPDNSQLRFYDALAHALLDGDKPVLLVLDDLQHCDHTTLHWLRWLIQQNAQARFLVVTAMRSEELHDAQIATWRLSLFRERLLTEITLTVFDPVDTAVLGEVTAGVTLTEEARARLYQETEGNPLFIVEAMRSGLNQGTQAWPQPLPPAAIQAVLALRITQLSSFTRSVAGLAATVGRTFSTAVLMQASGHKEAQLVAALDELLRHHVIRERAPDIYEFSHQALRAIGYAQLSPAMQRYYQRRVAAVIAGDTVRLDHNTGTGIGDM